MKCITVHISYVSNRKFQEMVKTNGIKPTKSEKASASPNKLTMSDNGDEDTDYDIKEVAAKADHSVYDELVASTFIVLKLNDPVDRSYKSSAGLEIIDVVINVEIIDPKGCKRVIVVWGSNANKLHDFFLVNGTSTNVVYVFPLKKDLEDASHELYMGDDKSSYLQFSRKQASASQANYYSVDESYVLTTSKPNSRKPDLDMDTRVLPSVVEWPTYDYYTAHGIFLETPDQWNKSEESKPSMQEHDFSKKSPVKAFKPSY